MRLYRRLMASGMRVYGYTNLSSQGLFQNPRHTHFYLQGSVLSDGLSAGGAWLNRKHSNKRITSLSLAPGNRSIWNVRRLPSKLPVAGSRERAIATVPALMVSWILRLSFA